MGARGEHDETERAVLDALADRGEEGMTVLELRGRIDSDIDDIETALETLKEDGHISANRTDGRTVIRITEGSYPDAGEPSEEWTSQFLRRLRRALRRFLFP